MKFAKLLIAAAVLGASSYAVADDEDQTSTYASQLCTLVASEKSNDSVDNYVQKLETLTARSQPPHAMNNVPFDKEQAGEVAQGWVSLSDEDKKLARSNNQQCQQMIMEQAQPSD